MRRIIRGVFQTAKKVHPDMQTLSTHGHNLIQAIRSVAPQSTRRASLVTKLQSKKANLSNYWQDFAKKRGPWKNASSEKVGQYFTQNDPEYRNLNRHQNNVIQGRGYFGSNSNKTDRRKTQLRRTQAAQIDHLLRTTSPPPLGHVRLDTKGANKPHGLSGMFEPHEIDSHDVDEPAFRKRGKKMTKEEQELNDYIAELVNEGFSNAEIVHMIQMDEGLKNTLKAAGRAGMTFAGLASAGASLGMSTAATMGLAGVDPKVSVGTGAAIAAAGVWAAAREAKKEFNYRENDYEDIMSARKANKAKKVRPISGYVPGTSGKQRIGKGFTHGNLGEGKNEDNKRDLQAYKQGREEGREEGVPKATKSAVKKGKGLGFKPRNESLSTKKFDDWYRAPGEKGRPSRNIKARLKAMSPKQIDKIANQKNNLGGAAELQRRLAKKMLAKEEVVMEQKAANARRGKVSLAALKNMSPQQRARAMKQAKQDAADKKAGKLKPKPKTAPKKAKAAKPAGEQVEKQPLDVLNTNKLARSMVAATPHKYKQLMQDYLVKHHEHVGVQSHLKTTKGRQAILDTVIKAHDEAASRWKMPSVSATKK